MGIRGLKPYVNNLPFGEGKVWEPYDLCDTNLIIDGNGLYYYIHETNKINIKYGGQYEQLKNELKKFFRKLRSNNVVPYVVVDGIMDRDKKKIDTIITRKQERIQRVQNLWTTQWPGRYEMVPPMLAEMAVVHILQEIEVPYAVADFEADCEIAVLANELNAPVMANDSDFFIFNVKHGYIPFQHYHFSGSNVRVRKFSFNGFAKYLGMDLEMSPLLASLTGNDYVSREKLTPFTDHLKMLVRSSQLVASDRKCEVPTIAQFLSKYESVSEAFDAVVDLFPQDRQPSFEKTLRLSVEEYQRAQSNLIGYFHSGELGSNIRSYNGAPIPQWLIKSHRKGLFAPEALECLCNRKLFLRTQSEDISKPSAQICVERLRWYYYALAMNYEVIGHSDEEIIVTEFVREGSRLVPKEVNLEVAVPKPQINIHAAPKMSSDTKNHVLSLLDCKLSLIHDLPIEHQLVVSALRYWIIHSRVKEAHLAALLVHYLGERSSTSRISKSESEVSAQVVHGFAQWQNVLYWVQRLNSLFSFMFPPLQVAKLYDGIRVCSLYQRLQGIKFAESIVCETEVNLYRQLYDAVTKDLPRDCLFNQSRSRQQKESRQSERGNGKFALLLIIIVIFIAVVLFRYVQ